MSEHLTLIFSRPHLFLTQDLAVYGKKWNANVLSLMASYSYYSLAILVLVRQIEESKFPKTIYKCSFTFISLLEKFRSRKDVSKL